MHLTEHEISQYTDALRISSVDNLPDNMLEHVEECFQCKHAILELSSLLNEIEQSEDEIPAKTVKISKRPVYRYWLTAAAVFVLLLPLYMLFSPITDQPQDSPQVVLEKPAETGINSISAEVNKDLNKGSDKNAVVGEKLYAVLDEYESVAGENFRSEKTEVISPGLGENSSGKIKFNIVFPGKGERVITVLNNKNEQVFSQQFNEDVFMHQQVFKPGLYYWKVENASSIIYVGKFTIKQ